VRRKRCNKVLATVFTPRANDSDPISRLNAIEVERTTLVDALAGEYGEAFVADVRKALHTHDMRQVDAALRAIGHAP
jgi:hypothetical protein